MIYLVEIKSFEDLKAKYREWALKLHPDMGGTNAEMQVLNNEYDQLFPIWKNRSEVHTEETADSDRKGFYTQNGWAGKNYKFGRTTKEVAEIIRTYLKEVYSDCKWSVRYSSSSMCTHVSVALMEAPYQVFVDETKTHIDLNEYYMDKETRLVPEAKAMMADVVELINSYRYDDSDGMIDYFDTNFYLDVSVGKWDKPFKVVYREKKKPDNRQYETVTVKQTKTRKAVEAHLTETSQKYGYTVREDVDTRDHTPVWLVKFTTKFDKETYIKVAKQMRELGGYYSKFKSAFLFRVDPTEQIKALFA